MKGSVPHERIYAVIRRIPAGRVATYGQIAALMALPRGARQVGYALAALRASTNVPWHRVVNAGGGISLRGANAVTQGLRLAREGVTLSAAGRLDLAAHAWKPTKADAQLAHRTNGTL